MSKVIVGAVILLLCSLALCQDNDEAITSNPTNTTSQASSSTTESTSKSKPKVESRQQEDGEVVNSLPELQCQFQNVSLRVGDKHALTGECVQLTCHPNGMITGITCPFTVAPPECTIIPQDLSKPYPKCCETWTCARK